jgi:hypothetical protein
LRERIKIICPVCEDSFFHDEINEKNATDICECKNIEMGIRTQENSRFEYYVTAAYNEERPIIEIIKIEDSSTL